MKYKDKKYYGVIGIILIVGNLTVLKYYELICTTAYVYGMIIPSLLILFYIEQQKDREKK